MKISMKAILLTVVGSLTLSGCQIATDAKQSWKQLNQIVDLARSGGSNRSVSRITVMGVPFATLGFRYGNGPQVLITLVQTQAGRLYWVSSDGLSIVTEHGRIVTTSGFPSNLSGGQSTAKDPLTLPHALDWAENPLLRLQDYKDDFGFGHVLECNLADEGVEEITLLDSSFNTRKFSETCEISTLNWSFENTHWIDLQTGFLWRTSQWISPRHKKPVVLEVLRPSADDPAWQIHSALKTAY